jgi:ADP-heptose:LPS heptosyltransferase
VVVAPPLAVRNFAALLGRCTLVVTGDTGPMHLAAAVGIPTVAVFHTTNAASYAPRGPAHRVVQSSAEGTVARVLGAVDDILAQRGSDVLGRGVAGPLRETTAAASRALAPRS